MEELGVAIDVRHLAGYQPSSCHSCELVQVDVRLSSRVDAGDVAREHARVWGFHISRYECDSHSWHGLHPEHPENMHMCMTTTNKHQIRDDRFRISLHPQGHHGL
jgi:hypothetical protein